VWASSPITLSPITLSPIHLSPITYHLSLITYHLSRVRKRARKFAPAAPLASP